MTIGASWPSTNRRGWLLARSVRDEDFFMTGNVERR
jgi:hypothetical protein